MWILEKSVHETVALFSEEEIFCDIYRFQLKIAKLAFPLRGRWRAKRDG